jgi:enterochelin esterase-like enzyme
MTGKSLACIGFIIILAFSVRPSAGATATETSRSDSPRLTRLLQEIRGGNRQALALFWGEINGKAPLVEWIDNDTSRRRITFVWRGSNDTTGVTMMGGLPGANLFKPLMRLADTDVWFLTEVHSTQARFQYAFQINGPEAVPMELAAIMNEVQHNPPRMDPFNPREYAGWSYVELQDAPPQPWIEKRALVPVGRKANEKFKSQILNAEYSLSIYTPQGYKDDSSRCWLMIAFDGGFRKMDVTLDNLLNAEKIPPLVVVGVQNLSQQTRMRDLDCSDAFANFLTKELVPWARKTYRVYDDPAHTIVGGVSLGGKMAAWCGLKHSDVFGKVLSQSGSFLTAARQESPTPLWEGEAPGMLAAEFLQSPRLPLEFYLEVGRYETTLPFSHLLETRRLRDVLKAKGYPVTYSEFVGGHNEVCWRGSFADAIIALTTNR